MSDRSVRLTTVRRSHAPTQLRNRIRIACTVSRVGIPLYPTATSLAISLGHIQALLVLMQHRAIKGRSLISEYIHLGLSELARADAL